MGLFTRKKANVDHRIRICHSADSTTCCNRPTCLWNHQPITIRTTLRCTSTVELPTNSKGKPPGHTWFCLAFNFLVAHLSRLVGHSFLRPNLRRLYAIHLDHSVFSWTDSRPHHLQVRLVHLPKPRSLLSQKTHLKFMSNSNHSLEEKKWVSLLLKSEASIAELSSALLQVPKGPNQRHLSSKNRKSPEMKFLKLVSWFSHVSPNTLLCRTFAQFLNAK